MILALMCAAQFMVIVDTTIVNVALPDIQHDLGLSNASLTWVVNAYVLAFAGFLMLGGRIADLWGRRRMYLVGLGLFSLMSLLGGLSQGSGELIGARAIQGLGAAAMVPAIMSILMTTYTEQAERIRALGIWASVSGAGGATGVLLGGVLTDLLSWRWIFFVNVPIGVALIVLARVFVPAGDKARERTAVDWAGAVTVTLGVTAIAFGVVSTSDHDWGSVRVTGSLIAGVVLLALFVATESRHRAPLMPLGLLRSRSLTGANVAMVLVSPAVYTTMFYLSQYLQDVHGYSPLETGLAFLPMPLAWITGSQISARLVGRVGVRTLLIVGPLVSVVGLVALSRLSADDSYALHVGVPAALTMLGISMAYSPITLAGTSSVGAENSGLAAGILNTTQQIGGAVGLAAMVSIASARTRALDDSPIGVALTSGYARAFAVLAALVAVTVVVALTVIPRHSTPGTDDGTLEREVRALHDDPALAETIAYEPDSATLLQRQERTP
ncbi:MFS transporter [Conexibacter sp. CPCC 206217]|uniref:MFS transporter n=1 Tax=Conexibacter sp. CPCC 206217 TaxID=3064574 RepID=UPI00272934B2|nr:MFS transporter [Conexibacter sp. CPCC 206217]MDO8212039.1 MFS transporter [Conexibacter sp. CPCC 206217]